MSTMRALVVYYSRTGHTRTIAEALAPALGADVEELRDPTERRGVLGYLRSGLEATLGVLAPIDAPEHDPSSYDLVVIGGPVWGGVPSPIRTYLWLERARLPRTAFFVTYGGFGAESVLEQMGALAGKKPVATLAVREREMGEHARRVKELVEALVARAPQRKISARRGRPRAIRRR
jgi:flavodoxin